MDATDSIDWAKKMDSIPILKLNSSDIPDWARIEPFGDKLMLRILSKSAKIPPRNTVF